MLKSKHRNVILNTITRDPPHLNSLLVGLVGMLDSFSVGLCYSSTLVCRCMDRVIQLLVFRLHKVLQLTHPGQNVILRDSRTERLTRAEDLT